MPSFIKTPKDEEKWKKAKEAAHKTISGEGDDFWALTNHIYQKMKKDEELDKSEIFTYSPQEAAIAVLDKVKELLEKSELTNLREKGVHESVISPVKGKDMGRKSLTDKTYGHPGIPTTFDPKQAMGTSTGRGDKKAHKEILSELKDMPKPNLPKSEEMDKNEPHKMYDYQLKYDGHSGDKFSGGEKGFKQAIEHAKKVKQEGKTKNIKLIGQTHFGEQHDMSHHLDKNELLAKSNSDPDIYKIPDQFSEEEMYNAIRQDIMAEYDAINLYEAHKHASDNEKLIKIFDHIIKEEKEHVQLLEDFLKENGQMEKAEKGIHKPQLGRNDGRSVAGGNIRVSEAYSKEGDKEPAKAFKQWAVEGHKKVLNELKDMPKPSLPKSESSTPKSARLTGVKITKKLPKPDDKPSVFFKEEKMEPEIGIEKLMKFLENRKNKKK